MKTVIEGKVDVFLYRATLVTSNFFASNNAKLIIITPRNWYGRMLSPPLPIANQGTVSARSPMGMIVRDVKLTDVVHSGSLQALVKKIVHEACAFPQAVKTS